MANVKHTGEEKRKFSNRLYKIYDKIPNDFMNRLIEKDNTLSSARITNVRYGKVIDFHILELLEEVTKDAKVKV